MTQVTTRTRIRRIIAAGLLAAGMAVHAAAAPFTPGNIIVATAPTGAGVQQITITEYTPAGAFSQDFTILTSGPVPFGATRGNSTSQMQINFSELNNQHLYVATTYTNTTATKASGYVRLDASGANIVVAEGTLNTRGVADARGVVPGSCRIFNGGATSGGDTGTTGTDRFFAGGVGVLTNLNPRFYAYFEPGFTGPNFTDKLLIASATTGGAGVGIYTVNPFETQVPTTATFLFGTMGAPQSLHVADADTIYVAQMNESGPTNLGIHKFRRTFGVWNDLGRNGSIGATNQANDVDAVVSGNNVTLYVVGGGTGIGGTTLYSISDTLTSDDVTWQGQAASSLVTGLVGARSVAVVPPMIVPPTRTLTTTTSGLGNGTVTRNPNAASYAACSTVELTAVPDGSSVFVEWTGDVLNPPQSANPLTIVMDANKTIDARFEPAAGNFVLSLTGTGNGTLNVTPPGTDYTSPGGPFNNIYAADTMVFLNATPATNWIFDHWTGDVPAGEEMNSFISVTMNQNRTIGAVFKRLFSVRLFATGNGTQSILSPPPDGIDINGNQQFRDGSVLQIQANAGTVGFPATPWTFVEWHDANNMHLSSMATYTTNPIVANTDFTARYAETPLNASAQPFTPGNVVVGTIRDFGNNQMAELREYDMMGRLVQPVVQVPNSGAPSIAQESSLATTIYSINFDVQNPGRLYVAGGRVNGAAALGFIRTLFSGGNFVFDLAAGRPTGATSGRGVVGNGDNVFFSFESGTFRYNIPGDAVLDVNTNNTRMVEIFNGDLYVGSASSAGVYAGGPGIFRIDDPTGTPVHVPIVPLGLNASPLDFAYADAENLYVGFQGGGGGYQNVHKFRYNTNTLQWDDMGNLGALGVEWARGVDVFVDPNNVDVKIYVQTTATPSDGRMVLVEDKLDNTSTWPFVPVTNIVPRVTRGRSAAVVPEPACTTCRGDVNGDGVINGGDIEDFVGCQMGVALLRGVSCACADMDADGNLGGDVNDFDRLICALLGWGNTGSCPRNNQPAETNPSTACP